MHNNQDMVSGGGIENLRLYIEEIANSNEDCMKHHEWGNIYVKKDSSGYIIIPDDQNLKSGWGSGPEESFHHFLQRNNYA